jgi:hypothetical protein
MSETCRERPAAWARFANGRGDSARGPGHEKRRTMAGDAGTRPVTARRFLDRLHINGPGLYRAGRRAVTWVGAAAPPASSGSGVGW